MKRLPSFVLAVFSLGLGCKAATGTQCNLDGDCETGICLEGVCATADDVKLAAAKRCRETKACKLQGTCTVDGDGRCVVGSSQDCEKALVCPTEGKCEAKGNTCVAAKNEHCARTDLCTVGGRCTAESGICVIGGDEDCAKSAACPPACSAIDGPGGSGRICGIGSEADCAETAACKVRGQCRFSEEDEARRCVALDDTDCVEPCRRHGNCARVDDQPFCQPRSDRDCQASLACRKEDRCKLVDGKCVEPPPKPAPYEEEEEAPSEEEEADVDAED